LKIRRISNPTGLLQKKRAPQQKCITSCFFAFAQNPFFLQSAACGSTGMACGSTAMSSDGEPALLDDMELDRIIDRLESHSERLAMERESEEGLRIEHTAMELNEFESNSDERNELFASLMERNEHKLMYRSAAESESLEETHSGHEQQQLVWENYWFNHEELQTRRNLVVEAMLARIAWEHSSMLRADAETESWRVQLALIFWEHSSMLRGDAEAESCRVQLSGQEQQLDVLVAENYAYHVAMQESYQELFGDVVSDEEEVVAAPPTPPQSKYPSPLVPRQPLHPPPPAPPKHGRPGGPNAMFIPAQGDSAGHALRYQKDKHNERERNRKVRRAMEKVIGTTLSKAGTMSASSSSSTTWVRPLLNPPPPPPAKRSG
jgi:hypothetical protein